MRKRIVLTIVFLTIVLLVVYKFFIVKDRSGEGAFDLFSENSAVNLSRIEFISPYDKTVFPPEMTAASFKWTSRAVGAEAWHIRLEFQEGAPLQAQVKQTKWTPDENAWGVIKKHATETSVRMTIVGVQTSSSNVPVERGAITFSFSSDPVEAPLFYREVPLPFIDAVKDPSKIRWRFGDITSSKQPPVVLDNLPVCGNCHSFSADGKVLGMDVDYANDKGSYVLTKTASQIVLDKEKVITWSDIKRDDNQPTFGLLSQVSPDGRYAVSTVKDRSVFVPKPNLAYSQLFFPLKGILAYYDRDTKEFKALPGADDPAFVHSNPTWSPDGKTIVFARSKAYNLQYLEDEKTALLTPKECQEFLEGGKKFKFDLYRIPFNNGEGGEAVPIQGASDNGQSNFFAKYSPDGKWIVFCQAESFMLLQPDSKLFIIPAKGGHARPLKANRKGMNSWHSWSPNSKWLVFASKAQSPYTQLFLTHIDDAGNSTPPVVLSHLTSPDRAANIPEFVNLPPSGIARIREGFVDDNSYMRTALENIKREDLDGAAAFYQKALELNPQNAQAHAYLGGVYIRKGELKKARDHSEQSLRLNPDDPMAHNNLGNIFAKERRFEEAVEHWHKAIALEPENIGASVNLGGLLLSLGRIDEAEHVLKEAIVKSPKSAETHHNLGNVLSKKGKREQAVAEWKEAVRLDKDFLEAYQNLSVAMLETNALDQAIVYLKEALRVDPNHLHCLLNLSAAYGLKGEKAKAIEAAKKTAALARKAGRPDIEQECLRRMNLYRQ